MGDLKAPEAGRLGAVVSTAEAGTGVASDRCVGEESGHAPGMGLQAKVNSHDGREEEAPIVKDRGVTKLTGLDGAVEGGRFEVE
jgi:hypothetical protein